MATLDEQMDNPFAQFVGQEEPVEQEADTNPFAQFAMQDAEEPVEDVEATAVREEARDFVLGREKAVEAGEGPSFRKETGFLSGLMAPRKAAQEYSIIGKGLELGTTSEEEIARRAEETAREEKATDIAVDPILAPLQAQLDVLDEVKAERELTPTEDALEAKLFEVYSDRSKQMTEEKAKAEEEGPSIDVDALWAAASEDPTGMAADFVNMIVGAPELLVIPGGGEVLAARLGGTTGRVAGRFTGSAAMSAAVEAVDSALSQQLEGKELDAEEIKTAALIGGISGGLLYTVGAEGVRAISQRMKQGDTVVTATADYLDQQGIDPNSIDFTQMKFTPVKEEGVIEAPELTTTLGAADEIKPAEVDTGIGIEFEPLEKEVNQNIIEYKPVDIENLSVSKGREEEVGLQLVPEEGLLKAGEIEYKKPVAEWTTSPGAAGDTVVVDKGIPYERPITEFERTVQQNDMDIAWAQKEASDAIKKEQQIEEAWSTKGRPANLAKSVQEQLAGYRKAKGVEEKITGDEILDGPMQRAFTALDQQTTNAISKIPSKESGKIDPKLAVLLGSSAAGGAYGYGVGDVEGAIAGTVAGVAIPLSAFYGYRGAAKTIGKLRDWSQDDKVTFLANGNYTAYPSVVLKSYGEAGRTLANMIDRAQDNVDLKTAERVANVKQYFKALDDTDEALDVQRVLQHIKSPAEVSPAVREAADNVRAEIARVLDDSVDTGVLTRKQADELAAWAKEKGYFPREYDEVYLSSKKGEDAWVQAWTDTWFRSEDDMREALEGLLGIKDKRVDSFIEAARKQGKKFALTPELAKKLLAERGRTLKQSRSGHLEHSRRLHPQTEAILEQFLVKDPRVSLVRYFHDVYRRIEMAREFDEALPNGVVVQDSKAMALFDRIFDESATNAKSNKEFARQLYYTVVGDSAQSDVLKNRINQGENQAKFQDAVSSFETVTKLGLAQIPNALQAVNNGTIRLSKLKGGDPLSTYKIALRGVLDTLKDEGQEFAERSGAALETTMMQLYGEAHNITNISENFLKYSGFIAVEKFQRSLAANMGKAYAEDLIAKKVRIDSGKLKGRKADKVIRQMEEIGLPTDVKQIDADDLHRAGLRFSNEVNFSNRPDRLPMMFQSPWAKVFLKFKSFAVHQGRFVKENVIKPAVRSITTGGKEGTLIPLMQYSTVGATMGMGADSLRRLIQGDDRNLTATERYIRGLTLVGGAGIMQDLITQATREEAGVAAFLGGPFVGDVGRFAVAGKRAVDKGSTQPLASAAVRSLVFPGKKEVQKIVERPADPRERLNEMRKKMRENPARTRLEELRTKLRERE